MDIAFERFHYFIQKWIEFPQLSDIVSDENLDIYIKGKIPELTTDEVKRIEDFLDSKLLSEVFSDLYYQIWKEVDLNVAIIPNQDQLKRYLGYLLKEVEGCVDQLNDLTYIAYMKTGVIDFGASKETEKKGIFTRVHHDPISNLLDGIVGFINQYEQIHDYLLKVSEENGVLQQSFLSSNLIFKGLPADFIELLTGIYELGSIQKIDGTPLKRIEVQKAFRKFLNLENVAGYDDKNLSKRLSERKMAVKASYIAQLKKSFENYSKTNNE